MGKRLQKFSPLNKLTLQWALKSAHRSNPEQAVGFGLRPGQVREDWTYCPALNDQRRGRKTPRNVPQTRHPRQLRQ